MYPSRTERYKAQRQKKRRRLLWLAPLSGVLLGSALVMAVAFISTSDAQSGQQQSGEANVSKTAPSAPGMAENANQPRQTGDEQAVRLTIVGDVMMAGKVETRLKEKGYDFPYAHVTSIFQQDDYTIANLETPITKRGTPEQKQFVYKSSPEAIPALKAAGVDLVNLANNHILDQGVEGLLDTIAVLNQNGIDYVGAGADADRAYAPVFVERNGITMAFLGFSRIVPAVNWYSGKNKPGVAATYDPKRAVESIRAAKEKADLVIVIAHWGIEKTDYPVDHQKQLARAYIDAGADLVVGGHPHVLQGFESYKNKWIAYSLGNFIFTRSTDPKTWETMVLQATCTKTGDCQLRMLPYHAELGQPVPMNQQDGSRLLRRIEGISVNVRIQPDGQIMTNSPDK